MQAHAKKLTYPCLSSFSFFFHHYLSPSFFNTYITTSLLHGRLCRQKIYYIILILFPFQTYYFTIMYTIPYLNGIWPSILFYLVWYKYSHTFWIDLKLVSTDAPSRSGCENYFVYVDRPGARNLRFFFIYDLAFFYLWSHFFLLETYFGAFDSHGGLRI